MPVWWYPFSSIWWSPASARVALVGALGLERASALACSAMCDLLSRNNRPVDYYCQVVESKYWPKPNTDTGGESLYYSILKFFQVDITGMFRMTSRVRYFREGVGSSRPNWRWIMCFLERPKANTSCKAVVKRLSFS